MQPLPAINQEFIHDINSKRPMKRFTRLFADQIRATDFQTTQIEKAAIQQHRDQVTLQRQQAHQHQEILQLMVKHQKEMAKKLEALYKVLEQSLIHKKDSPVKSDNQPKVETT